MGMEDPDVDVVAVGSSPGAFDVSETERTWEFHKQSIIETTLGVGGHEDRWCRCIRYFLSIERIDSYEKR